MAKITPPPPFPWRQSNSLLRPFSVPLSGMTAQRIRMETIVQNLANMDTAIDPNGASYQRQIALLQRNQDGTVQVQNVQEVATNLIREYDPDHPMADDEGFVSYPDINPEQELADLLIARRMFEANATVFDAAKAMIRRALEI